MNNINRKKDVYFSVITVTKNAQNTISDTIKSVTEQNYDDYEYIIWDGLSTDDTVQVIYNYGNPRIKIYSGIDDGIYDAMNKALKYVKGDYIIFLGSGDLLYDNSVLREVAREIYENNFPEILYGDVFFINNKRKEEKLQRYGSMRTLKLINLAFQRGTCHQAIFAKRDLFENNMFDLNYNYNADEIWLARCLKRKIRVIGVDLVVSRFDVNGFTSSILYTKEGYESVDALVKEVSYLLYLLQKPLKAIVRSYRYIRKNK